MDDLTQRRLLDRLNSFYTTGGSTLADGDMVCSATTYSDPVVLAAERRVMQRHPVIVGHSSALASAGDFLTDDSLGTPLLIVRQTDGKLKAFLNICRHRGSRLCSQATGNRNAFVCPYHAWTYRNDGSLLSAHETAFPSVDPHSGALVQLPVEERHGFIWVVATPGAAIDVAAHLGIYDAELAAYGLADFVVERETVLSEEINWKYVLDGFLEVYHIPVLHARSIAPYIYGKYCVFETAGLNSRLVVPRKTFDEARKKPAAEINLLRHIAANYQIFPNSILVWQGDHFELWTAQPGDRPDRCTVRITSLTSKALAGDAYKSRWDRNWKVLIDTVVSEDWALSKAIQRGIPYLTEDRVIFGRNEPGLQHFHGTLAAEINAL